MSEQPIYTIICTLPGHEETYAGFLHEADVLLAAMQAQGMTAEEMREVLRPYEQLMPEVFHPEEYGMEEDELPNPAAEWDELPATRSFISEVESLDIPGVEIDPDMGRPMSYEIERLAVRGDRAMEALSAALRARYRIRALPMREWEDATSSLEAARNTIAAVGQN